MTATNGHGFDAKTIPNTMRAQQMDPSDLKLHLNEVPVPTPSADQILVKILCASLCHSDIMILNPNDSDAMTYPDKPTTMGHEGSGLVVQVGSGVQGFKPGDKVGFLPAMNICGECIPCRQTSNIWCEQTDHAQNAGFGVNGFFADYAVVEARQAMILPDKLDPWAAAPLFCAGVTAFHAIDNLKLPKESWVAIVGCGGLGHLGIQYVKAMGYKVIGLDMTAGALEEAKACGADHVLDTSPLPTAKKQSAYIDEIRRITGGGADAAVNFTASKKAYADMPSMLRPGRGSILMAVGIPAEPMEVNLFDIAMNRYRMMGANNGVCYNMPEAIQFSADHDILPHVDFYALEDLPLMVEKMVHHKARGRMAVQFK